MYNEIKDILKNLRRKANIPYFFENKKIFLAEDVENKILIVNILNKDKENANSCKITIDCEKFTVVPSITIIESNIYHIERYVDYIRDIINVIENEISVLQRKGR